MWGRHRDSDVLQGTRARPLSRRTCWSAGKIRLRGAARVDCAADPQTAMTFLPTVIHAEHRGGTGFGSSSTTAPKTSSTSPIGSKPDVRSASRAGLLRPLLHRRRHCRVAEWLGHRPGNALRSSRAAAEQQARAAGDGAAPTSPKAGNPVAPPRLNNGAVQGLSCIGDWTSRRIRRLRADGTSIVPSSNSVRNDSTPSRVARHDYS